MPQYFLRKMTNKLFIQNTVSILPGKLVYNDNVVLESCHPDIKDFIREIYKFYELNYPKFFKMDNLSKLGFIAAEIACKDFNKEQMQEHEIALLFANSESTMETDINFYNSIASVPSPAVFVYTLPNIMLGEICIRHMFKGENYFFISKSIDVDLFYNQILSLFDHTSTKVCFCAWIDLKNETDYVAKLTLINKFESTNKNIIFTPENLKQIYQ